MLPLQYFPPKMSKDYPGSMAQGKRTLTHGLENEQIPKRQYSAWRVSDQPLDLSIEADISHTD